MFFDASTGQMARTTFAELVNVPGLFSSYRLNSMSTNKLLGRGTAGTGGIEEITLGTNLSLTGTTLNATGGATPNGTSGQALTSNGSGGFGTPVTLSTTGGANNVLQLDGSGNFRTAPVNSSSAVIPPPIRVSARQRVSFENYAGIPGYGAIWMVPDHSPSGLGASHHEMVYESGRHCFYWDDGFQMGNAESARGNRFLYFRNLGTADAGDPTRESLPVWFDGNFYNGGSPLQSKMGLQWVPSGDHAGEFVFAISGSQYIDATNGNRLKTLGGVVLPFSVTQAGPKVGSGKVLTFGDGSAVTSRSDIAALAVSSVGMPAVRAASAAMSAGVVTFTPTSGSVTNYTQVSVTRKTLAAVIGNLTYGKTNGTPGSITVTSSSNLDTSVVTYHAVEGSSDALPPVISGTSAVTDPLTATSNGGALQWYSNNIPVSGQTSGTYIIRHEDIGLPITVKEDGVVSNSITAWKPSDEASLFANFRADLGTLTTGGGAATNGQVVETWQDQSGNARHMIAGNGPTTANAPLLDTSGTGGRPTFLNFDGVNDYMIKVSPITLPQTVFVVAESKTETGNERFFSTGDSGTRMALEPAGTNDLKNNGAQTTGDQIPLNTRHILTGRTTATLNACRVDANSEMVATETTGNGFGILVGGTSAAFAADQRHYALLVYQGDLDAAAQLRVRKYLKAKWGTP